jgi:flagellar basal body rod protein FlgG
VSIAGLAAAQSGLMAQTRRLQASAHNTANLNTNDFRALRVSLHESANPGSGVETSVSVSEAPGPALVDDSGLLLDERGSNVDLVDEAVTRLTASRAYEANLVSLQAQSDMSQSLFDLS